MFEEFPHALLTTEEVGKLLRVSKYTLYSWHRAGRYGSVRVGGRIMWPKPMIEKMLEPIRRGKK